MSIYTIPINSSTLITNNLTTNTPSRLVHIGTAGDYEFYFPAQSAWVRWKDCVAGQDYPITVTGARLFSGGAEPASGDITFGH